jgi:hypothetical protein
MRNLAVTAALAALVASSSGCFTFLGGISGAISDNARPAPPTITPAQRRLSELPPTSMHYVPAPPPTPEDTGMSGGAKGVIAGAAVDAMLFGLGYMLFSDLDVDYGCGHGDC